MPLARRSAAFSHHGKIVCFARPALAHDGDTWRAVYTVRYSEAIYVLHSFQRKSKRGIATPKKDIDLIRHRLAEAERLHRERQN